MKRSKIHVIGAPELEQETRTDNLFEEKCQKKNSPNSVERNN